MILKKVLLNWECSCLMEFYSFCKFISVWGILDRWSRLIFRNIVFSVYNIRLKRLMVLLLVRCRRELRFFFFGIWWLFNFLVIVLVVLIDFLLFMYLWELLKMFLFLGCMNLCSELVKKDISCLLKLLR